MKILIPVFVLIFISSVFSTGCGNSGDCKIDSANLVTVEYVVMDLEPGEPEKILKEELGEIQGVTSFEIKTEEGVIVVKYDEACTNEKHIAEAIENEAGLMIEIIRKLEDAGVEEQMDSLSNEIEEAAADPAVNDSIVMD
jgi:copper chaperone CopZ